MAFGKLGARGGFGGLGSLGGANAWLLRADGVLPDVQLDFANNRAFVKNTGIVPVNTLIATTRVGSKTNLVPASPSGFAYSTFAGSTLAYTLGVGYLFEGAATNNLLNSTAPATQTTASLGTGIYTLWVNGSGSATLSNGTATGASGVATQFSPATFTLTVAGTVTVTVSGSLNAFQLESGLSGTSLIVTAGATASRAGDNPVATGALLTAYKSAALTQFVQTVPNRNIGVTNTRLGAGFNTTGTPGYAPSSITAGIFSGATAVNATIGFAGNFQTNKVAVVGSFDGSGESVVANGGSETTNAATFGAVTSATIASASGSNYLNSFLTNLAVWSFRASVSARASLSSQFSLANTIIAWGDSLTAGNEDGTGVTYPNVLFNIRGLGASTVNEGVGGNTSSQILTRFNAASIYWNKPSVIWSGRNNAASQSQVLSDIASMVSNLSQYLVLAVINGENEPNPSAGYTQITSLNAALASAYGNNYLDVRSMLVAAYNAANPVDVIDNANDVPPFTLRANDANGTITSATVLPAATSFNTSTAMTVGNILTVGTEYILVTGVSGNNVTSCTRGYAGTVAGSYSSGQAFTGTDPLHLNAAGYTLVAQWVQAKIVALGW